MLVRQSMYNYNPLQVLIRVGKSRNIIGGSNSVSYRLVFNGSNRSRCFLAIKITIFEVKLGSLFPKNSSGLLNSRMLRLGDNTEESRNHNISDNCDNSDNDNALGDG